MSHTHFHWERCSNVNSKLIEFRTSHRCWTNLAKTGEIATLLFQILRKFVYNLQFCLYSEHVLGRVSGWTTRSHTSFITKLTHFNFHTNFAFDSFANERRAIVRFICCIVSFPFVPLHIDIRVCTQCTCVSVFRRNSKVLIHYWSFVWENKDKILLKVF